MPSYNILSDYGIDPNSKPTSITVSPYWVIAVFNLRYPASYVRAGAKLSEPKGVSVNPEPLIIVDDCATLTIKTQKENHVGIMTAALYPSKEYLSIINPGDYVFAWIVNSEAKLRNLVERIKEKKPCNKFEDGLKFYGKINSIREGITQEENGPRYARFTLSATSFNELDATFFYEEKLATLLPAVAVQIERLNLDLNKLVEKDKREGYKGLPPDNIIIALIDVYLGSGVKENLGSGQTAPELTSTFGVAGKYSHILPSDVGQILNKAIKSGAVLKSADVLETLSGVQNYSEGWYEEIGADPSIVSTPDGRRFNPNNTFTTDSRRYTGIHLLGWSSPIQPKFINQSLWSVLTQYLNSSCNELYATLRTNAKGDITPTVVLRQLPFTTDAYSGPLNVTKFKELPRWIVPDIFVRSVDVGRSDSIRINFIHVYGSSDSAAAQDLTTQMINAPPYFDSADIARSGLRPYTGSVPCLAAETRDDADGSSGPKKWMNLIQDFMMGQHMTLTGTLTSVGIYSPICIGDNVEWDNNLYHIQSVTHSCQIDPMGHKKFTTSLALINGVGIDSYKSGGSTDVSLYARIGASEKESSYIPANNTDSVFEEKKPAEQQAGVIVSDTEGLA